MMICDITRLTILLIVVATDFDISNANRQYKEIYHGQYNKIYHDSFSSNKFSKIVAPMCPVAIFATLIQPDIGFVKITVNLSVSYIHC